jgi:hypothetical protein
MKKIKLFLKAVLHVMGEPIILGLMLLAALVLVAVIAGLIANIPNINTIILCLYLFLIACGVLLYIINVIVMVADAYKTLSEKEVD